MTASWDYGLVAFLDVLGFAALVEADSRSASPEHLDRLLESLAEARSSTATGHLDLRAFSDSIIISAPLTLPKVCDITQGVIGLQRIFVRHGVLVRGAIAFGKHYSDPEAIYSEALVLAYRLEKDHARFPRVLIDANLFDWFDNDVRNTTDQRQSLRSTLLRDRDNQLFLNYLDPSLLAKHREIILSYNATTTAATILEKIQWLALYHNHIAALIGPESVISGPLSGSFQTV